METYQAITSWALFLGLGVFCFFYYWPETQRKQTVLRNTPRQSPIKSQQERSEKKPHSYADAVKTGDGPSKRSAPAEHPRKRNVESKKPRPAAAQSKPTPVVHAMEPEPELEVDSSAKQFAEQMLKARKGEVITGAKSQEQRIRTVKQSNAHNEAVQSFDASHVDADADDDLSPINSPAVRSGDVSDMLEPIASGPSVLRVTGSAQPQKEKVNRSSKEEPAESKKQRQNRKKVEERRLQRESDEQERKAMMEKQRRAAREARGEPARNGIPASKPTTKNVWTTPNSAPVNEAPAVNGTHGQLLDTFDAESTSSSNGALGMSTAATSATDGNGAQWDHDLPSEEEQMAQALKESEDESGWTTVAVAPKKQGKNKGGEETPVPKPAPVKSQPTTAKAAANGRPKGFQALEVQYEQRTDVDPNDADNWDA